MSQTTFAEQYSAYRDSQGFIGGVDMEIRVDGVTEAEKELLEQIGNVYTSSLSKILSATKAGVKSGKLTMDEAFNLLKKLNIKLLSKNDNAASYSSAFVGGMKSSMAMYGGVEMEDNMKAASEFFINSAEFVGGVANNITANLSQTITLYRIYMNIIREIMGTLVVNKDCSQIKSGIKELYIKLNEVVNTGESIIRSLGSEGQNYAKELENAFNVKDMAKMKELLKNTSNNKELIKLFNNAARLQAPTLFYGKELLKALDVLNIKKEEINKIRNNKELDDFIDNYLMSAKAKGKNVKKVMKSIAKVRNLLNRKFTDKKSIEYKGADDSNDSIDDFSGAVDDYDKYSPKCGCTKYVGNGFDDLFSGGEFEELEKEIQLKLGYANVISALEPQKKRFIEKNNEFIDELMIAAKEAAYDFHKSNKYTDTDVLFFIRRLMMLRNINSDEMKVFYTTGVEYNTRYIRDEYIARLKDLMEASKAIESKIGSKQKAFTEVLSKYISFLVDWDKAQNNAKYSGAKDEFRCSGINNMSIYDKYEGAADFIYGGLVGKTFDQIVGVFAKSIALGRLQNGMNITIDEVKKYSKEQDNINEKIIGNHINQVNITLKSLYDTMNDSNKNFPIPKNLAGQVIRDNFNGYRNLMYAAQALDKKIRTYHLKIIENPLAVNDLVTLMKKVVVDMNWITDMDFTDLKEFNKYFHVESVANANNVIADNTFVINRDNANTAVANATGPNSERNNYRNNAYLQQNGLSPFPVTTNTLYKSHVSTLIAATHSDIEHNIEAIVAEKESFKVGTTRNDRNVNLYYGKSVFPAKFITLFNNGADYNKNVTNLTKDIIKNGDDVAVGVAPYGAGAGAVAHIKNIQNPIGITNSIKFVDPLKIERFYRSAQASLRKGVDTILKIRDIMSVFDKIDKSYAKDAGVEKDGEKIGKIYNAIKEYLVLTSMYPILYAGNNTPTHCGFIAKRDFGHAAICISNNLSYSDYQDNIELLGDINRISLVEYFNNEYSNARSRNYDLGRPFPVTNAKDGDAPGNRNNVNLAKYNISNMNDITNMFKKGDITLIMMIKSMYTKIMSIIAMYTNMNMIGSPNDNLPFHQLRTIYGGQVENIFNSPPNIVAENAELYVRMLYYMLFYKKLFFEEEYNVNIKNLITGAKRMALLPINDGKFTGIMKLVFLKWFEYHTQDNNFLSRITDMDISTFVNECNIIMDSTSGANTKAKTVKIMQELVTDINQRYGLVSTDDILNLMRKDRNTTYPSLQAINKRYVGDEQVYRARVTRKTKPILDGEEDGYDLDVPSKSKEYTNTAFGDSVSLLNIEQNYNIINHLASVQNFRKKLDEMTEGLDTKFRDFSTDANIANLNSSGLFVLIRSLEYKLKNQSMVMDKLRILKEYLFTRQDMLVYDISREIMIYRELVITPCNLLFKLYVRIIAMINIHGKDQIFVDPLLRNTMLYYLDSVNTNLVTVANTGGSPMLDFSNLENTCQMYLDQVRAYHMQVRSGVNNEFSKKMENVINFLYNTHRAIFMDQGLISKIDYNSKQVTKPNINGGAAFNDPGVMMNPLVDYSEFLHITKINTNNEGQNSFIIDQGIYGLIDRPVVRVKDPRLFVSQNKDLRVNADLEFELLSFEFSPKNIYVLFEYLLVMIYKVFCEPYGRIYTPLMEKFAQAIEPIIGTIDINNLNETLNQEERFRGDMPFSDKVMFLYKTLYKFNDKGVFATENDITKLSKEQVTRMSQNLPLFMFLFKFIVKQAAIHNHMLLNKRSYLENSNNALVVSMDAGLVHGLAVGQIYHNLPEGDMLAPILGGGINMAKAKDIIINSKTFATLLGDFKTDILLGYNQNVDDLNLYNYVISGLKNDLNYEQKCGLLLSRKISNNKKLIIANTNFTNDIDELIKLFKDLPKVNIADSKTVIAKVESVGKKLQNVNKELINLNTDTVSKNTITYLDSIVNNVEIGTYYPIIMKFIDKYIDVFGKVDTLIQNQIPDLYDKDCYQNYLVPAGLGRVNAAGTFPINVAAVNKDLNHFIAGYAAGAAVPANVIHPLCADYNLSGGANISGAALPVSVVTNIEDNAGAPSYVAEFNLIAPPVGIVDDDGTLCGPVHNAQYVVSTDDNTLKLPIFASDVIYNTTYTNIISMIEGIPSSFIPENNMPALDQTPEHMGLFADCFTSYQYYMESKQNNKIEDFDQYMEKFIEEKVNMIFMKGFDEFFGFYFKFIDCRYAGDNLAARFARYFINARLQDDAVKPVIDANYAPNNPLALGAAGSIPADFTNFVTINPARFINQVYNMTHTAAAPPEPDAATVTAAAYSNTDNNHLATLYKVTIDNDAGLGIGGAASTLAAAAPLTIANLQAITNDTPHGGNNPYLSFNTDTEVIHDTASAAYIGSMPFQSYSSIGKFYPYYGTYDKNNIYNVEYYIGDNLTAIDPRYYFYRLLTSISKRFPENTFGECGAMDNFMIPNGMPTATVGTLSIQEIQKYILPACLDNAKYKAIFGEARHRIFTKITADDVPDILPDSYYDRLFNWIRDIGYFILGTDGAGTNTLENKYNIVKRAVLDKLREHYITNKNYLPILRVNNTPCLANGLSGVVFEYNNPGRQAIAQVSSAHANYNVLASNLQRYSYLAKLCISTDKTAHVIDSVKNISTLISKNERRDTTLEKCLVSMNYKNENARILEALHTFAKYYQGKGNIYKNARSIAAGAGNISIEDYINDIAELNLSGEAIYTINNSKITAYNAQTAFPTNMYFEQSTINAANNTGYSRLNQATANNGGYEGVDRDISIKNTNSEIYNYQSKPKILYNLVDPDIVKNVAMFETILFNDNIVGILTNDDSATFNLAGGVHRPNINIYHLVAACVDIDLLKLLYLGVALNNTGVTLLKTNGNASIFTAGGGSLGNLTISARNATDTYAAGLPTNANQHHFRKMFFQIVKQYIEDNNMFGRVKKIIDNCINFVGNDAAKLEIAKVNYSKFPINYIIQLLKTSYNNKVEKGLFNLKNYAISNNITANSNRYVQFTKLDKFKSFEKLNDTNFDIDNVDLGRIATAAANDAAFSDAKYRIAAGGLTAGSGASIIASLTSHRNVARQASFGIAFSTNALQQNIINGDPDIYNALSRFLYISKLHLSGVAGGAIANALDAKNIGWAADASGRNVLHYVDNLNSAAIVIKGFNKLRELDESFNDLNEESNIISSFDKNVPELQFSKITNFSTNKAMIKSLLLSKPASSGYNVYETIRTLYSGKSFINACIMRHMKDNYNISVKNYASLFDYGIITDQPIIHENLDITIHGVLTGIAGGVGVPAYTLNNINNCSIKGSHYNANRVSAAGRYHKQYSNTGAEANKARLVIGKLYNNILVSVDKLKKLYEKFDFTVEKNKLITNLNPLRTKNVAELAVENINPIAAGVALPEVEIKSYNDKVLVIEDGTVKPDPIFSDLCMGCGSPCKYNDLVGRAKNAMKFGTLVYKSLSEVYAEIGKIPQYLETNPYLKDIQSLISPKDTMYPTTFAIDLIPGIINTYRNTGAGVYEEANICTTLNNENRKPLGLHCNNIRDLNEMLLGSKNSALIGMMPFLMDDKVHKLTAADFPWTKSLVGETDKSSDIITNVDTGKLNTFLQNFGTLTKYLYEIEMKEAFADMFPIFNSLANPKFQIRTVVNPAANPIFGTSISLYDKESIELRGIRNSLPTVLQFKGLSGGTPIVYRGNQIPSENASYLHLINMYKGYGTGMPPNEHDITNAAGQVTPGTTTLLNERYAIDIDELLPIIEMNTNINSVKKRFTDDNHLNKQNNVPYGNRNDVSQIQNNMVENIIDIGIFPINIHAMMREIPLANTINNNYSFDIIADWITKGEGENADKFPHANNAADLLVINAAGLIDGDRSKAPNDIAYDGLVATANKTLNDAIRVYTRNLLKNPFNLQLSPIVPNTDLHLNIIFSAIAHRLSLNKMVKPLPDSRIIVSDIRTAAGNNNMNFITNTGATAINSINNNNVLEFRDYIASGLQELNVETIIEIKPNGMLVNDKGTEIKTNYITDNGAAPIATPIPLQYNGYICYPIDPVSMQVAAPGGAAVLPGDINCSRSMFSNPDLAILAYSNNRYCSSNLVKRLLGDIKLNNLDAANMPQALPSNEELLYTDNTRNSYYYDQMSYKARSYDLVSGVDKNLSSPVIAVNIYAEVIFNMFTKKVKELFDNSDYDTSDTTQTGVISVFAPMLTSD